MDKETILIVDDEARIRKLIRDYLIKNNYNVMEAEDGAQALDVFFAHQEIALILLDVMMPKYDGWEVLKEIRTYSKVPIIMLTAKGDESSELLGFKLGVDEYISKPFSPKILMARIANVLRRNSVMVEECLTATGIVLNRSTHEVLIDGQSIDLSFKEFELLAYFMENKGLALSRDTILNHVWNFDYEGDERTIDTHVKKLRSKMGERGNMITTVWAMGYKFVDK